jgi:bifunctional DNA-binding transcriptional regulator/antitoxin component of YhaV-PrlF toxin-antitoxin module
MFWDISQDSASPEKVGPLSYVEVVRTPLEDSETDLVESVFAGGAGTGSEMPYNSHLANRSRLRSITGTVAEHPPLPIRPASAPVSGIDTFESVIDNIVTLPIRSDTARHLVDIRTLDGGRLYWKPISEVLGWAPGDPLSVSWVGEWMHLSPTTADGYSRVSVDERGRISIEAGLRARLCIDPTDRVVVRVRPGTNTLEVGNDALVVRALADFDAPAEARTRSGKSAGSPSSLTEIQRQADHG